MLLHEPRIADQDALAGHATHDAESRNRLKVLHLYEIQTSVPGVLDDGIRQWVLGPALGRSSQAEQVVPEHAIIKHHVGDGGLAPREGPCFVKDDVRQSVSVLQHGAAFDQDPVPSGVATRDHQRGARRQGQRAGAGDDEDGDHMRDGLHPSIRPIVEDRPAGKHAERQCDDQWH